MSYRLVPDSAGTPPQQPARSPTFCGKLSLPLRQDSIPPTCSFAHGGAALRDGEITRLIFTRGHDAFQGFHKADVESYLVNLIGAVVRVDPEIADGAEPVPNG